MRKPARLRPGDKVCAVSLSWGGPGAFPLRYAAGRRQLEDTFGLQLVESRHALADPEWLADHPQARADDLMEAFADDSIRAVISTIGGDDSIRLLPFLDIEVIRKHPKIFMGFSDTTVTHFACWKADLVSFYGPSIMAGFAENGGMFPYTIASLRRTLFSTEPIGELRPNPDGWTSELLSWHDPANQEQRRALRPSTGWRWVQGQGTARGPLIGGCLEVLDWLRGTPVWPELSAWQGAILFFETSEDEPSPGAVGRMLRALAACGVLGRIAGILVGRPHGQETDPVDYDNVILEVVVREQGFTSLPIISAMDFGHTDPMMVLPYGVVAEIDCDKRRVSVIESAVEGP